MEQQIGLHGTIVSIALYALGLPVLRRRKSTFIYGIEDDAREVIDHLGRYLAQSGRF
jgi:putative flavoprotein involved in K+ transport